MKSDKPNPQTVQQVTVRGIAARPERGLLSLNGLSFSCALGRSGRKSDKREGDGATPIGAFHMRQAFYRADRILRPRTSLPLTALRPDDGWCDEPGDRNYNRRVRHPYQASAEHLWRTDHLYDVVVVLGYNETPRVRGRGSAIFMHVAGENFAATAGCVALRIGDLLRVLERASTATSVNILA
jgi:L,D-peptidoglycan transpeptidase YkuD (ErfK/YbiS/YcfS/YnhG family)